VTRRIFGLDFSGAEKAGRLIWLAEARQTTTGIQILSCRPAAELPGGAADREKALGALRAFIATTPNAIFGCDFPFSLPRSLIAAKAWPDFLAAFDHADAGAFRQYCRARTGGREPRRKTDEESKTPWCAFNIRLHHQTFHGLSGLLRPLVSQNKAVILPMQKACADRPWIIETCPASTLAHLDCRVPYKGGKHRAKRGWIVERLIERARLVPLPAAIESTVLDNKGGDALDSIVAALTTAHALQEIGAGVGGGDPLEGRVYFRIGRSCGLKSPDI
jgi:hypothetical protein